MRLWSGTQIAFGRDGFGPSVVAMGNVDSYTATPGIDWKLDLTKEDGTRIWRPVNAGKLDRIQVPCPDELTAVLQHTLGELPTGGIHPAILNGMENEALRLYPELDPSAAELFASFTSYLKTEFRLDEAAMRTMPMKAYTDGFGPGLLVLLDENPVVLPELPEIWLAPDNWHTSTWRVTNGMMGPVADETMESDKRLQFHGDLAEIDGQTEGLVYYQAARAMVAWAAWENDKSARFVKALVSIITQGYRPLAGKNL